MHINPRSVLRPEYLETTANETSASLECSDRLFGIKRVNTNTAPIYWLERPVDKRMNLRRPMQPHKRYSNNDLSTKNLSNNVSHSRSDSESDDVSPDTSSSPCLSYTSRYSSDSTNIYDNKGQYKNAINRDDSNIPAKAYTHGQAEQLRRSRESTTFALIDSQLSMSPLNRVRDMYLQNRNGSVSGSSSSAARTTKKANLSVVHTVVRFRVKDYLVDLRDHVRELLDTLFYSIYDDYDVKCREKLAEVLGVDNSPCSTDCKFCPGLFGHSERLTYNPVDSRIRVPCSARSEVRESTPLSEVQTKSIITKSVSTSLPMEVAFGSLHKQRQHLTRLKPEESSSGPFAHDNSTENNALVGLHSVKSTGYSSLSGSSSLTEKPLPSYHNHSLEQRSLKRMRLDSTSLRLVNEFDNSDWSVEDIDFGPCGEELVDLHTLVSDSNPDLSKCEDSFFDSAYDISDLLRQFTNDKYPNFPLAISP